jgi:hypothetical protein
MSSPIRIWTSAAHHPAFRCGGWANVRVSQGLVSRVAGGDRYTTAPRMALAGLVSALRNLPAGSAAGGPVSIHTSSPDLASFAGLLAGPSTEAEAAPEEDLDLWAQILTASKGRRLDVHFAPVQPDMPTSFTAAWAELAMNKAKATGPFTAAIPKLNLAKIPGLIAK